MDYLNLEYDGECWRNDGEIIDNPAELLKQEARRLVHG